MKVSIVVPVLNEAGRLPALFDNIDTLRAKAMSIKGFSIELIIVDGGSTDRSLSCATNANVVLRSKPGRARQMNLGARYAAGELLVFLHADTSLPEEIVYEWQRMITEKYSWGFAPVHLDHQAVSFRIIEWCMNIRSRLTRVATGDQVLCITREAFEEQTGFADIDLMEDVEFSARLRKANTPLFFRYKVRCSVRKWLQHGTLRTVCMMWGIRAAYFFGVSPRRLHNVYYRRA